ncbi:hypothetical protein TZ02_04465 [Clostridium aceticum]|nr:hypothetical protein TZ02_04465 [Clostridium aceticum]
MAENIEEIIIAFLGSPFFPFIDKKPYAGTDLFSANAPKVLGALIRVERAEDNTAPIRPATTATFEKLISNIIKLFSNKLCVGALYENKTAIPLYVMNPVRTAANVPIIILFLGFFNSPDIVAPVRIPVTAGKKMANVCQKPAF